jgi:hypothetical protein
MFLVSTLMLTQIRKNRENHKSYMAHDCFEVQNVKDAQSGIVRLLSLCILILFE